MTGRGAFDVTTGEVVASSPERHVATFAVRLDGGELHLDV